LSEISWVRRVNNLSHSSVIAVRGVDDVRRIDDALNILVKEESHTRSSSASVIGPQREVASADLSSVLIRSIIVPIPFDGF